MLVHFRERIDIKLVNKLNQEVVKQGLEIKDRDNRAWCKERGIRISELPLVRPPKNVSK
jgi:hypothetical protein